MGIEIGKTKFDFQDKIDFLRTFDAWMSSGGGSMSIAECIGNTCDAFKSDEFRILAPKMNKIYESYRMGDVKFAEALRDSNLGFTHQEIMVILTAENSNQLRQAVHAMVEAMKMQQIARKNLVGSLRGPIITGIMLIIMTLGVAYFMLPIVLGPTLEKDPNALYDMPWIIRCFWYFSQWLVNNPYAPALFIVVPLTYYILHVTGPAKALTEKFLMSWGASRKIIIAYNGLLVVYFMPALVRSGMPVYTVLKSLADMVNNSKIKHELLVAGQENEAGYPLEESIRRLSLKSSFKSSISAGEKTGAIAERVDDLKVPYAAEYERIVARFVNTIKFLVMAILVPLFIMSMYTSLVAPIFALLEF